MKTTDSENLKDEVKTNEQREPALTHKRTDLEALADEVERAAKRGDFERAEQKRRELKKALDETDKQANPDAYRAIELEYRRLLTSGPKP